MDLRPSSAQDSFETTWIDLTTSKPARSATVSGGDRHLFTGPRGYPGSKEVSDWLLYIVRK